MTKKKVLSVKNTLKEHQKEAKVGQERNKKPRSILRLRNCLV